MEVALRHKLLETIYTIYTVYTIQTVLHCLDSGINSGMFLYNKQCSV